MSYAKDDRVPVPGAAPVLLQLVPSCLARRVRESCPGGGGAWQGSADDRAWRKGFVSLEVMNPQGCARVGPVPAWVNRSAHNGAWQLAAKLPADSPTRADVRWPDGSISLVPLITAANAYAEFSKPADLHRGGVPGQGMPPAPCDRGRTGRGVTGDQPRHDPGARMAVHLRGSSRGTSTWRSPPRPSPPVPSGCRGISKR